MSSKNSTLKRKNEKYALAQNQVEKVIYSYEALERMKQNLLSAISLFFSSNKTLKFCLIIIIHISSKSSVAWFPGEGTLCHKSRLISSPWMLFSSEEFFGAECMQMLTETRILSLPDWQEHSWSLQEEMAITERTVYFAGRWFAQSQQTITPESLFSCTELHVLTVPLGDSLLSTEQKALTRRKRKKENQPICLLWFCFC